MLGLLLLQVMPLKKKQWKDIRQKYNLADHPYEEVRTGHYSTLCTKIQPGCAVVHGIHKQGVDTVH